HSCRPRLDPLPFFRSAIAVAPVSDWSREQFSSSRATKGRTPLGYRLRANDLSKAIGDFRARFHYLPGDLPSAANDLQGIPAACNIGVATAGIGNGLIEAGESPCVGDHLFAAGLIKADADPANAGRVLLRTSFGTIRVIASGASGVAGFPVTSNVVEFQNLSCDAARTFDDKLDNGNFASGRVLASVASCTPGAANDPVPFIAIRLN
ncbi:MAG: hypothetical protein U1C47_24970, partial [Hydrogenophaga sp.]|nr:hypothetical protein [Hydrogenophaga sp.]